jgi:putative hydrolase of the HAD superfamily
LIQTIVFDFGNVVGLLDHYRTLLKLTPYTDLTAGAMYDAVYGSALEDQLESGVLSTNDFLARVHKLWRLRCDVAFLSAAIADIFTPNPEVCNLVPILARRYRLLLGSNTNAIHAEHFTRQFGDTLSHFHALVLSHEIGVRKPRPGFFEHCQTLALGDPAACLFIDDLEANVTGARAMRWHGLVYRPGEDLPGQLRQLGLRSD